VYKYTKKYLLFIEYVQIYYKTVEKLKQFCYDINKGTFKLN